MKFAFSTRKHASIWVMAFCLCLLAAAQVWLSHLRYEMSQTTQQMQQEQQTLTVEINTLQLELASLTRPERLRRLAKSKLGMAPPRPLQVVRP